MNISAYGFEFFKFEFEFLRAVQSSYLLKAKHTLNSVCGLLRSARVAIRSIGEEHLFSYRLAQYN